MFKFIASMLLVFFVGCTGAVDESKIVLTAEEQKFIAEHPTVTWAVEENRPPYSFIKDGKVYGISVEYLLLISKKTGLQFRAVQAGSFSDSIEAVKTNKIDLMFSVRPTPERAQYLNFTPPYIYNGGVYVYRANTLPKSPLTTGIRKGEASKAYLLLRFPDMKIIETSDDEEAMSLLQKGLVDGAVMDEATADYLSKQGLIGVRKATINFDYPYSIGYNKNNLVLGSILTKAIDSISAEDKRTLNRRWLEGTKS